MNLIGSPFAQYEKSHHVDGEEFVEGMVVNERGEEVEKIGAYWYTKEQAAIERQARHDYCQAWRDERAQALAERKEQIRREDESLKAQLGAYDEYSMGAAIVAQQQAEKVYQKESARGDVATSIGYWVFFLIIFAACVFGIISSL